MTRILIAEDQEMVRGALISLLELEDDIEKADLGTAKYDLVTMIYAGSDAKTIFNGAHLRIPATAIHIGENTVTADFSSMIAPARQPSAAIAAIWPGESISRCGDDGNVASGLAVRSDRKFISERALSVTYIEE